MFDLCNKHMNDHQEDIPNTLGITFSESKYMFVWTWSIWRYTIPGLAFRHVGFFSWRFTLQSYNDKSDQNLQVIHQETPKCFKTKPRRDPNLLPAPHADDDGDDHGNGENENGKGGKGGKGRRNGKGKGKGKDNNGPNPDPPQRPIPKAKTPDQEAKQVSWI